MMNLDKIRARLKALREKTAARGCTEAEAIAAAEKVAELLATYGLTEEDLDALEFATASGETNARRSPIDNIWPHVANFCACRCWLNDTGRAGRGRMEVVYLGRAGDVLIAEYVHEVIRGACVRAEREFRVSDTYLRRRTDKTRGHALRGFQEGFAASLIVKLRNGLWRRLEAQGSSWPALIAPVDQEKARRGIEYAQLRRLKPAAGQFRDNARVSGFMAGRAVDIHAPVPSGAGGRSSALPAPPASLPPRE